MVTVNNRTIGIQRNKLLRYKLIKELYNKIMSDNPYIPLTVAYRVYIYPVYPISKTTLYEVLCTPITSELKAIETLQNQQLALFD